MTKSDYTETIATLLSLDINMTKDLANLQIETLSMMFNNYIQNAKDSNNKLDRVIEASYRNGTNKPSKIEVAQVAHNA